ncbi:hypothetical protein PanWU01x14_253290 [Parasponia andersonii]|uniref:Uncharacterized protein n=1 Tax=Parasponia andersonii TaxID=3476 RepID=A0A2P5BBQ9_PARAD|nr:hypothetical protein PanWU01x14_253290 [Parasponia andersonii]
METELELGWFWRNIIWKLLLLSLLKLFNHDHLLTEIYITAKNYVSEHTTDTRFNGNRHSLHFSSSSFSTSEEPPHYSPTKLLCKLSILV